MRLTEMPGWLITGLLILSAGLAACSRDGGVATGRTEPVPQQQHAGKLAVRIVPEAPTSSDDLQAVFTGTGNVTYRWEKNGQVIDGETTQRLPKGCFAKKDHICAVVTVGGDTGSASVVIRNSPPEVTSVPFMPEYIHRGVDLFVAPIASDADGDEVRFSYKWSLNREEFPEDVPMIKGDRFKKGDKVSLKVTPFDSEGAGTVYQTQALVIPNAPPVFKSVPPQDFKGTSYHYNAKAEDADGDEIIYSLSSAPQGMTVDSNTGRIVWSVGTGAAGAHTIEVVAEDKEGARNTQKYTLTITMPTGATE